MRKFGGGLWLGGLTAGIMLFGSAVADDPLASRTQAIQGVLEAPAEGWAAIELIEIDKFPWDERGRFRSRTKTILEGPDNKGRLIYAIFPPTFSTEMPPPGRPAHYHHWHEWGYTLKGDSVLQELISPYQQNGMLYRKTQGGWLSRPAYSLHGGTWVTGGQRAQYPYHLLLFEEGDGSMVHIGPDGDHANPDFPDQPVENYDPDWKSVTEWTKPWLVAADTLDWQDDPKVPGRFIKYLSDDIHLGFRAQLVKIPPGWEAPPGYRKTFFEQANRMRYLTYGDMKVWHFASPTAAGQSRRVGEDTFIYQPPRSIWGYGPGPVTELGAIWLEVTYSTGLEIGGPRIEDIQVIE